jgi:sulfate transport system ATP-binding protein
MSIQLKDLTKRFGANPVVDHLSLEVADGELFVLLGPSGSGKSTVLRLVAGLTPPDGGEILLHGTDVTNLPPQRRGTGFVFQNYSVFRHMTVGENVEFALRIRGTAAEERARRRDELLELVGLGGFAARDPRSLSGGQLQRVALARSLAHEPKVLLLDEPFGALDVKIRGQLRRSLKEIQRSLKVTTILVTHDQEEAFELGDRIGIIDDGRLLEVGSAEELYSRPQSGYAATFVGSGTVLVGRCRGDEALLGPVAIPIPPETPHEDGSPVRVLLRPENVALLGAETKELPVLGRGQIIEETFAGSVRRLRLRLPRLPGVRQIAPIPPFGEEGLLIDAALPAHESPPAQPWVGLRDWHILRQPRARLLIAESGAVSPELAAIAAQLRDAFEGTIRVLRRETPERSALPEPIAEAEEVPRPGDVVEEALAEQERTA